MEKSLSAAFGDSLKEESVAVISELTEVTLDTIMEDGILKDIPIISTAIGLYKIGNSILERHNLKKLIVFLDGINKGTVDDKKRNQYRQRFQNDDKFRNQEIEYLLVLINRYIDYEKPKMLAKLYLAYLDNEIEWNSVVMFSTIIDVLLPEDIAYLLTEPPHVTHYNEINSSILRLVSVGLLLQTNNDSAVVYDGNGCFSVTTTSMSKIKTQEKIFGKTELGKQLTDILKK